MMEFIVYTIAGITLYFVSDEILTRIEAHRGERFEHRTLIFFTIILVLALGAFRLIEYIAGG